MAGMCGGGYLTGEDTENRADIAPIKRTLAAFLSAF